MQTFGTTSIDSTSTQTKGIVFAVILHVLLFMFFLSTIRVIKTNAGGVPEDWNTATEKELSEAVTVEKRVLRNIRRQIRKRKKEEAEEEQRKLLGTVKEEEKAESAGEEAVQNDSNAEVVLSSRKRLTTEKGSAAEESEIDNTLLSGQEQAQSLDQGGQGQGGPKQEKPEEDFLAEAHSDLISDYDQEIKNGRLTKDKIHQLAVMSAIKRGNKRFCAHCQKFKPERAHHCRQCGVCVLKMDHHCPWVANCVGFYNYKFFLNMIFYGDLLLLFTSVTYSEVIKDTILNPYVSGVMLYVMMLCYTMTLVLALILTAFFIFHLWLISTGKTTLEFCEKKRLTKYDFGCYGNFQRVLGRNPLVWMFPLCKRDIL